MIKTEHLKPETFEYTLKKTGTKTETYEKIVKGRFGRWHDEEVTREYNIYKHDEESLAKLEDDKVDTIMQHHIDDRGYSQWAGRSILYTDTRRFTRDFPVTLNNLYQKEHITKDNLISLEYCKDGCTINGAYITWEDDHP